jgi:hypothetical protein
MNELLRDTIMIIKDVHHMNFDYEFVSSLCIYILRKYVSLSELFELEKSYASYLSTRIFLE